MTSRHELRLSVMGTIAHVVTLGAGGAELAERACAHLRVLEACWSRFDDSSEVSRLNANGALPLVVSAPTLALVELGIEGWRISCGCFDPTILGDVIRAGYDRSFRDITDASACAATSSLRRGCDGIEVDTTTGAIRLPPGVGIDPGGIGKGLAADFVVDALRDAGVEGVCVNVGGDVRVAGVAPSDGWAIEVSHVGVVRRETVRLVDGAVATSATTCRSWLRSGARRHHLIDPRTGEPIDNDVTGVSVAAARGWQADVLTKAIFVAGTTPGLELADALDAAALVVTTGGRRHANARWDALTTAENRIEGAIS